MNKRIAHIISAGPTEGRGVPKHVVSPEFEVDIVESLASPFPTDAVNLMVADASTVEAAMRAQQLGYDGVLVGAVADYGIDAIRAAVNIPAIGCGQASMLAAASLGRRFAIVTIWPRSQAYLYDALVAKHGVGQQCVSIRYVSTDAEQATLSEADNFYTQMRAGKEEMLDRILAEIKSTVRDDGADAVVLGCNCMTPVAPTLAERSEVPVVDPTTTGYKYLEMLVSLGLAQSTTSHPPSTTDRVPLFADMIGAAARTIEAENAAECEVCVLSDDGDPSCSVAEPSTVAAS